MKHSFFKISNLKKALVILFSILILLSVSILIVTEEIKAQPDNIQKSIADKFNEIKSQLEIQGITKNVKGTIGDYSKLFDGFSNIIITDDNGKIIYKANDGYISEKNKFSILIDPWKSNRSVTDIAYVVDSKNNIKYSTELDISRNTNKMKSQSAKNALSKVLFPKNIESDDSLGDKQITNSDGSTYVNSSDTNIIMNYEYIASKGLNLYSLYDSEHQFNNYYIFTNQLNGIIRWLIVCAFIFLSIFWILLPIWVYKDSKKQNLNSPKWSIISFFTNILGLGIYLILRPKKIKCLSCNKDVQDDWILCPYCGEKINIKDK
ncbi:zinc ribbon domain-containing protein [Clostridium akagii]|uniref:zinc ribbon domain-containing protein n=1 Tax=Clostridium akagii TaxID=91623 RepID=UPI00047B7EDA|nr:zinc ribbon domain-containing protein [Clostridium akagii]